MNEGRMLGYREQQVLAYVKQTIDAYGVAPSYAMICRELDIATRGEVSELIGRLERKRLVSRHGAGRVRRIRLVRTLQTA